MSSSESVRRPLDPRLISLASKDELLRPAKSGYLPRSSSLQSVVGRFVGFALESTSGTNTHSPTGLRSQAGLCATPMLWPVF